MPVIRAISSTICLEWGRELNRAERRRARARSHMRLDAHPVEVSRRLTDMEEVVV